MGTGPRQLAQRETHPLGTGKFQMGQANKKWELAHLKSAQWEEAHLEWEQAQQN